MNRVLTCVAALLLFACGGQVDDGPAAPPVTPPMASTAPSPVPGGGPSVEAEKAPPGPAAESLPAAPAPVITAAERAKACAERDALGPLGTLKADPELKLGDVYDVYVTESAGPTTDANGKKSSSRSLSVWFAHRPERQIVPERGPSESVGGQSWDFSERAETALPPVFGPGRYEKLQTGFGDSSYTCWANGGMGVGGGWPDESGKVLIITSRTETSIEGEIEVPSATGTPNKVTFKAPLQRPDVASMCCP